MAVSDTYAIYAVRYGHHDRPAHENFIGGDPHDGPMPLAYYVWAIVGERRSFIVDTGFDAESGGSRGRTLLRPVGDGLRAIGVDPDRVEDVIITHMHYDHAGNRDLFPRARWHIQDAEMANCTGRCMCHGFLRRSFDVNDVTAMVRRVFDGRVQFHDGDDELAPGVTVHLLGGHSKGLQVVRVRTRRGWVVIGSDAAHFYAHLEQERPFPTIYNVGDMLEGLRTLRRLASSPQHIVPGHDPLVLARYPAARPGLDGVARLDADPAM
jgi:glyoxylase-like metal-dependent hydrolase (beta-lactamase superfamily II)